MGYLPVAAPSLDAQSCNITWISTERPLCTLAKLPVLKMLLEKHYKFIYPKKHISIHHKAGSLLRSLIPTDQNTGLRATLFYNIAAVEPRPWSYPTDLQEHVVPSKINDVVLPLVSFQSRKLGDNVRIPGENIICSSNPITWLVRRDRHDLTLI